MVPPFQRGLRMDDMLPVLRGDDRRVRQLRLRNLSGIIIIDFIDMETEEDQRELLSVLSRVLAKDPVKTSVVEITKLNLVEVTRKKIRRPFHEQAALIKGKADT